ncbi:MAG: LuxR C-terminal-related transcriptional regulator, partial [Candidatus Promineifilaceae bacterium]|nr:LuxR C-terminal-related transcriptional regulator [Candidatus Promineifilaceae bacterium]
FPEKKTQGINTSSADKRDALTKRELQVLTLLAAGLKTPEIASEMHLANSTVKWYLRRIYSKLDVHKRSDALTRARELNLL